MITGDFLLMMEITGFLLNFFLTGIRRRTRAPEWRLEQNDSTEQKVTGWSGSTQEAARTEQLPGTMLSDWIYV